jgi:hypothetical protein
MLERTVCRRRLLPAESWRSNLCGRNQTGTLLKITIPFAIPDSFQRIEASRVYLHSTAYRVIKNICRYVSAS